MPECPATNGEHCPAESTIFGQAGHEDQVIVCEECGEVLARRTVVLS